MDSQNVKTDRDVRGVITWSIGILIALVGMLAGIAFRDLAKAVDSSVSEIRAVAATVNIHTTRIEVLGLEQSNIDRRVTTLEQQVDALRTAAMRAAKP